MGKCYWKICTPSPSGCCPEHNGAGCAQNLWSKEDIITQKIESSIKKCQVDQQTLVSTNQKLYEQQIEIEQLKQDLKNLESEITERKLTRKSEQIQSNAETKKLRIEQIQKEITGLKNSLSNFSSIDISIWDNILSYIPKEWGCKCENEKVRIIDEIYKKVSEEKIQQAQLIKQSQEKSKKIISSKNISGSTPERIISKIGLTLRFGWKRAGVITLIAITRTSTAGLYNLIKNVEDYIKEIDQSIQKTIEVLKTIELSYRLKMTETCTPCKTNHKEV